MIDLQIPDKEMGPNKVRKKEDPKNCPHPSFIIVTVERRGFMVQLYCSKCKKPMPFDLCDKKEWDKKTKGSGGRIK